MYMTLLCFATKRSVQQSLSFIFLILLTSLCFLSLFYLVPFTSSRPSLYCLFSSYWKTTRNTRFMQNSYCSVQGMRVHLWFIFFSFISFSFEFFSKQMTLGEAFSYKGYAMNPFMSLTSICCISSPLLTSLEWTIFKLHVLDI